MPIGITRIDHVQVTVPRSLEAEAKRFYGELLGLEEIPKSAEGKKRGGAWYRHGTMQVHLSLEDTDAAARRETMRHVCYVVGSLAHAERTMRAAGVEILPDAHPEPGWRRFYVRDPAGNRVEIAEPGATSMADSPGD